MGIGVAFLSVTHGLPIQGMYDQQKELKLTDSLNS